MFYSRIIEIQNEVSPGSVRAFELSIGKTSGYLNMMKKNNGKPSVEVVSKIINLHPKYNLYWLLGLSDEKFVEKTPSGAVNEAAATYKNEPSQLTGALEDFVTKIVKDLTNPRFEKLNKDVLTLLRRNLRQAPEQNEDSKTG